jgi:hypothetical protein
MKMAVSAMKMAVRSGLLHDAMQYTRPVAPALFARCPGIQNSVLWQQSNRWTHDARHPGDIRVTRTHHDEDLV